MNDSSSRPLRTFGRVKGRPLKPTQERLLETLAPGLALPATGPVDPRMLFGGRTTALEIGFGGGEHLAAQAAVMTDWGFIGVEPFLNGYAACLRHLSDGGHANVRLHQGDARDVVARLPDGALARIWILFPDPWQKARHHKRRLIQPDFVVALARVLAAGGEVRFATDWRDYAVWTLRQFLASPDFAWAAERAADWRGAFEGHVTTRYETKRLGDVAPIFLRFVRR